MQSHVKSALVLSSLLLILLVTVWNRYTVAQPTSGLSAGELAKLLSQEKSKTELDRLLGYREALAAAAKRGSQHPRVVVVDERIQELKQEIQQLSAMNARQPEFPLGRRCRCQAEDVQVEGFLRKISQEWVILGQEGGEYWIPRDKVQSLFFESDDKDG